jgi:hypothetical protein
MVTRRPNLLICCLLLAFPWWVTANDVAPISDGEVSAILDRGTPGLFYAWSPHMPLSVDGLKEIIAAGKQLDVLVLPVLSPHANVDYARDRLRDRGLPAGLLRQSESAELVKQDLFLHAPAIIIFDEGEFVSPVLPGLRRADDYAELIGRFLGAAEE